MGHALGDILPLAVAIAVFPVPIVASVLLLRSERGLRKGLAFVLAWGVGLAAVAAIVLLFAGAVDADDDGEPATWLSALLLGLGLLLGAAAVRQWRGRPSPGEEPNVPGWMRTLDDFTTAKAAGTGFALSALNPKNALLSAAAASEIAAVGLAAGQQVAVLVVFVLIASVGVLAPLAFTVALGEGSREPLDRLRGLLVRHNAVVMAVLFLLVGAKLIGDAIAGFAG